MQEYIKCTKDAIHFIETYTQIISLDEGMVAELRGYQERSLDITMKIDLV